MNYRRNKSTSAKFIYTTITIVVILFLLISIPTTSNFLKSISLQTGKFFWKAKNGWVSAVSEKMSPENMEEYKVLKLENRILKQKLENLENLVADAPEKDELILSSVLLRPGQSPYDTFVIEGGRDLSISIGDVVFASDFVALGVVSEVFHNTSKITLFSSYNSKNTVLLGEENISLEAVGQGGQNIKIDVPEGVSVEKGDTVMLPMFEDALVGVVEDIINEPGETIKTLIVRSTVNMNQLRFVFVLNKDKNVN